MVKDIESNEALLKEVMSFNEAASYLDVSKSLLYKLTSSRKIRFYKPNRGKLYFKRIDLDNWMLQNEQKPQKFYEVKYNNSKK